MLLRNLDKMNNIIIIIASYIIVIKTILAIAYNTLDYFDKKKGELR